MNIKEALSKISPPKGMTSIISGLFSGDFDPIRGDTADIKEDSWWESDSGLKRSLDIAQSKLEKTLDAQRNCNSDWAYWGYAGDVAYERAAVDIIKAAIIVGGNNLPDVDAPEPGGVVWIVVPK